MSTLNRGNNLSINEVLGDKPNVLVFTAGYKDKKEQSMLLDLSVVLLDKDQKPRNMYDFFYYGMIAMEGKLYGESYISRDGSLKNLGNETLSNNQNEQQVIIDFDKIPSDVSKIIMLYNIFDSSNRRQNFTMVDVPYFRLSTMPPDDQTIATFENEQQNLIQSMELCHIYRYNNEWKIKAQGVGYNLGLKEVLVEKYGFKI